MSDWSAAWKQVRATGVSGSVVRSLSLFLPGTTQLLYGRLSRGLFFITSLLFIAVFCRAVIGTLDRLAPTLELLGSSATAAFWSLAVAFACAAALHLAAISNAHECKLTVRSMHPAVPGVASAIIPGWGQLLNGDRVRSLLFIAGGWLAAAVWIVSSDASARLLDGYAPAVTPLEMSLRNPTILWMFKWTIPVVLWTLAVYDASASAVARRKSCPG
jgi:TM2 domain-containing membrane protein YozV